jgi:hypothetical protein
MHLEKEVTLWLHLSFRSLETFLFSEFIVEINDCLICQNVLDLISINFVRWMFERLFFINLHYNCKRLHMFMSTFSRLFTVLKPNPLVYDKDGEEIRQKFLKRVCCYCALDRLNYHVWLLAEMMKYTQYFCMMCWEQMRHLLHGWESRNPNLTTKTEVWKISTTSSREWLYWELVSFKYDMVQALEALKVATTLNEVSSHESYSKHRILLKRTVHVYINTAKRTQN